MKAGKANQGKPPRLSALVKQGDIAALKRNRKLINPGNRERLLALAVTDFKSAPKKSSHVNVVRFLILTGARPDFHLVCAATVGPHLDILNTLVEAGADQNIFTAAALGDVATVRDLLRLDPTLASTTTDCAFLGEKAMTALHYACRSELGKANQSLAEQLVLCVAALLERRPARSVESDCTPSPLELCASRGGNVEIARLLRGHSSERTKLHAKGRRLR
jgi:hypothetical protein